MYKIGRSIRRFRWPLIGLVSLGAISLWEPWSYALISSASVRYDSMRISASSVPKERVAIVFGARVNGSEPTPYLRYRIQAAVALYKAGRVEKLLMTGDNSQRNYDEPAAMRQTAISMGVEANDITVDDAGFSTFDSCYRAKHMFMVNSAVLVTQNYHLPRAIMACRGVGITSIGYGAYADHPGLIMQYTAREWLSTDKIVLQLLTRATSKFIGPSESIE